MPILSLWLLAVSVGPAVQSRTVGPWAIDAASDRVVVHQSAAEAWPGGRADLVVRCHTWDEPGKILLAHHRDREVYLYYGAGFDSKDGEVMVSFDGEPPTKRWGAPSEDRHSFFIIGTGLKSRVDEFIGALQSHSKMSMVVTPKKQQPLPEVTFDLTGLAEALQPVLEMCPMKKK